MQVSALERFQIERDTIIFVPEEWVSKDDLNRIISGEKFTYSCRNENKGNKSDSDYYTKEIGRNLVYATLIKPIIVENKVKGYNITTELDIDSCPITRKLNQGINLNP